jgi:hypothetical protein
MKDNEELKHEQKKEFWSNHIRHFRRSAYHRKSIVSRKIYHTGVFEHGIIKQARKLQKLNLSE